MLRRRTFIFVILTLPINISSQSDSFTTGIQQNRSTNPLKKWIQNESEGSCNEIYRDKQVVIKSPLYPNNYPKNQNCDYIFYSPFVCVNEFHIQFLDFQLEPSKSCSKDKLIIGGDELLCGQVIGIMKYTANNGTLRIKFISDKTIESKGFELLVTRLPCSLNDTQGDTYDSSNIPGNHSNPPETVHLASKENNIVSENMPETLILRPNCLGRKWTDKSPQTTFVPALRIFRQPSCCVNVYNQQQFYLSSPRFPNSAPFSSDCLFHIHRLHSGICRLRIVFKYFLLGDWQHCTYSFLEIDGRRFCGCKSGSIYNRHWKEGSSSKSIRFFNVLRYSGIQGFLLEITQEECPYRADASLPQKSNSLYVNDPRRRSFNYIHV